MAALFNSASSNAKPAMAAIIQALPIRLARASVLMCEVTGRIFPGWRYPRNLTRSSRRAKGETVTEESPATV
ncbi:MAG: hypothetical protein Tsb0024_01970 [Ruegeria sp.]